MHHWIDGGASYRGEGKTISSAVKFECQDLPDSTVLLLSVNYMGACGQRLTVNTRYPRRTARRTLPLDVSVDEPGRCFEQISIGDRIQRKRIVLPIQKSRDLKID